MQTPETPQPNHPNPTPPTVRPISTSHQPGQKQKRWGGFDVVVLVFSGLAVVAGALAFLRASQTYNLVADITRSVPTDSAPVSPEQPTEPAIVDLAIDASDPSTGNSDAPVTIVEFSDFECPFCKSFSETTKQLRETYGPDQVNFVYLDFPLTSIHSEAEPAAIAAQCVADLAGDQAFFEYHDQLFANQDDLGDDLYNKLAASIEGLDPDDFSECYKNQETLPEVQADYGLGVNANVGGTPSVFINGAPVRGGAVPFAQLKALIDAQLK